jgi:hypothetical protein
MKNTLLIPSVPSGEAPLWVRAEWVGFTHDFAINRMAFGRGLS